MSDPTDQLAAVIAEALLTAPMAMHISAKGLTITTEPLAEHLASAIRSAFPDITRKPNWRAIMPDHDWVIAWVENYHSDPRIEPRLCVDVEEAVELAMSFEDSDDHHVAAIETPDRVLDVEEERKIEERLRAEWEAERKQNRAMSQPSTHVVEIRIPEVTRREGWWNWPRVRFALSESEAREFAAPWIEKLGADRVRIREQVRP